MERPPDGAGVRDWLLNVEKLPRRERNRLMEYYDFVATLGPKRLYCKDPGSAHLQVCTADTLQRQGAIYAVLCLTELLVPNKKGRLSVPASLKGYVKPNRWHSESCIVIRISSDGEFLDEQREDVRSVLRNAYNLTVKR